MPTETVTLTDFLLARIAEDEAVARDAADRQRGTWTAEQVEYPWTNGRGESGVKQEQAVVWNGTGQSIMRTSSGHDASVGFHIARHQPSRVLAECKAKRRIIGSGDLNETIDEDRRILAAVYADHPDYRDDWRP